MTEQYNKTTLRHAGFRWEVLPGAEAIVRSRNKWNFETLRSEFQGALRKKRDTRIVFPMETEHGTVGVKALTFDEFRVRLRSLYGRCRTRKEWENHLAASRAGLSTVQPLALGERRRACMVHEAVMLTEWRPKAETVTQQRKQGLRAAGSEPALALASDLGRITARAQAHGLYHNEIRPDNIIVESAAGQHRVLLIDWKHARIKRRNTANDLQNLVRTGQLFDRDLSFDPPTEAEKTAFLTAYIEETAERPDRWELLSELRSACPWVDSAEIHLRTPDTPWSRESRSGPSETPSCICQTAKHGVDYAGVVVRSGALIFPHEPGGGP